MFKYYENLRICYILYYLNIHQKELKSIEPVLLNPGALLLSVTRSTTHRLPQPVSRVWVSGRYGYRSLQSDLGVNHDDHYTLLTHSSPIPLLRSFFEYSSASSTLEMEQISYLTFYGMEEQALCINDPCFAVKLCWTVSLCLFEQQHEGSVNRAGSIYHFTHILSQNGFYSLDCIMLIIDFFENIHTVIQLTRKHKESGN